MEAHVARTACTDLGSEGRPAWTTAGQNFTTQLPLTTLGTGLARIGTNTVQLATVYHSHYATVALPGQHEEEKSLGSSSERVDTRPLLGAR